MKKFNYQSHEFNQKLDEYFNSVEFKTWADFWFPDSK